MKVTFAVLALGLCLVTPLTACADIGQSLAKMNIAAMDADDYFQGAPEVALVEAASRGDREGIKTAIANGANLNAVGKNGMTPLFWVIAIDPSLEGLQALLDNGADPNITTTVSGEIRDSEKRATDLAYTRPDPRYMAVLLDEGATARSKLLYKTGLNERLPHLKLLIDHGADVNYAGQYGQRPMQAAVYGNDFKAALLYLNSGADPALQNTNGKSALGYLKSQRERDKRAASSRQDSGYVELIRALKGQGYIEPDF